MKNKTAFVTGASRGIGAAVARALAAAGYDLGIMCEKNTDALLALGDELSRSYGIRVFSFTGDVGDADFVASAASSFLDEYKRIDVLVNNAGISHIGLLTDMSVSQWQRMIDVNLSSVFYTCRAFVPAMVSAKSGSIINISSMWGSAGASCEVAYSASKGGVNSFTRALAKELALSDIRVNAIACGCIDTDMNAGFSEEEREALCEDIPMGRFGRPDEVAAEVMHIIDSSYMTGQIIGVDGGYL
ncbi:MAG: SDR family NAD(P)-dependent oxidoreductase [Lachnospiraceae bacterium]|nr:SDR family NAD(P)-dependent oxidoreductase [Lachnospiraceae bacterium]